MLVVCSEYHLRFHNLVQTSVQVFWAKVSCNRWIRRSKFLEHTTPNPNPSSRLIQCAEQLQKALSVLSGAEVSDSQFIKMTLYSLKRKEIISLVEESNVSGQTKAAHLYSSSKRHFSRKYSLCKVRYANLSTTDTVYTQTYLTGTQSFTNCCCWKKGCIKCDLVL